MLVDLVCGACNKLFSTYERAWTNAPGEALARIAFGPSGRARKGKAYQVHPSEHVFLVSDQDPTYEVDILRGVAPRLRPQLVWSAAGVSVHASAIEDMARFKAAFEGFLKTSELTIQKRSQPGPGQFRVAVLSGADLFAVERVELRPKPAAAWLDRFPRGLSISTDPRVSVDADGRLRVRATGIRQATQTFAAILAQQTVSGQSGTFEAGSYRIAVRSPYQVGKVHRAIAKTLVNFAVASRGPAWVLSSEFRPIRDYCLGRIEAAIDTPFVGSLGRPAGIRAVDQTVPEVHALALTSNGQRVVGLVRLYAGPIYRVHLGPAPAGTRPFTETVWIDYNGPGRVPPFTHPVPQTFPAAADNEAAVSD